ncbi:MULTISPECIES: DUF4203 domain-containing protein [unclassified Archaeoglobus]|jgi:hypothetical protein|uniref:TM7S3/TM198-like domain-containing protein n=1 Tax=unclassified Archaeoglobus TaxID=2643606 RepID=UPI0025BED420|nr:MULTISPECIES: DUF4203 domain-containing protein [unclassified Archaeoglobus]
MQPIEIAEILTSQAAVLTSMVIIGLVLCFAGYRIFSIYSAAIGFLIGLLVGIYIVMDYFKENPFLVLLISAILGAVVFGLVFELGLIVTGAAFGYFFGLYLLPDYPIYSYILAGLFAFTNLFLERALTVLITAVLGASFIMLATHMAVNGLHIYDILTDLRDTFDIMTRNIFLDLLWFVLVLTGIITQLVLHKEEKEEEEE